MALNAPIWRKATNRTCCYYVSIIKEYRYSFDVAYAICHKDGKSGNVLRGEWSKDYMDSFKLEETELGEHV